MKAFRLILISHSIYLLVTAVWPLIDIESFMWMTGYKRDIWLVKTVAALLIPVSVTMASFLVYHSEQRPLYILGAGIAIAFISIDVYYALTNVIADVYLADAAVELLFLLGWIFLMAQSQIKKYNSKE